MISLVKKKGMHFKYFHIVLFVLAKAPPLFFHQPNFTKVLFFCWQTTGRQKHLINDYSETYQQIPTYLLPIPDANSSNWHKTVLLIRCTVLLPIQHVFLPYRQHDIGRTGFWCFLIDCSRNLAVQLGLTRYIQNGCFSCHPIMCNFEIIKWLLRSCWTEMLLGKTLVKTEWTARSGICQWNYLLKKIQHCQLWC